MLRASLGLPAIRERRTERPRRRRARVIRDHLRMGYTSGFRLVVGGSSELFALGGVAGQGFFNDVQGGVGRADVFDLDLLAFKLLVVLEEALENEHAVRGKVAGFEVFAEFGIV